MKFLVVDDHELIREAMRGALAELDGEAAILEAADSREAMRLIEEHSDLDLILLDLNLPDRDGFSVLSELRKSHPAISVVVLSAQQDRDSVVKALNQGARGFIAKSATRKVILGAVQLVISGGDPAAGASRRGFPRRSRIDRAPNGRAYLDYARKEQQGDLPGARPPGADREKSRQRYPARLEGQQEEAA